MQMTKDTPDIILARLRKFDISVDLVVMGVPGEDVEVFITSKVEKELARAQGFIEGWLGWTTTPTGMTSIGEYSARIIAKE